MSCKLNTTGTFSNSGQCLCVQCAVEEVLWLSVAISKRDTVLSPVTAKANMKAGLNSFGKSSFHEK